jgi:predicted PurR-regulated permease PerM
MNDILHANIFFFISSVATVLIALLILIILFYIARIMRDVSDVVRKINKASADIEKDFQDLRHEVKNEGVKVRSIVDVALGFALSRIEKRTVRKPKAAPPIEEVPEEPVQ